MSLTDRVDHVALAVRDIDQAMAYFVDHLAIPVTHDEVVPDAGVRLVYLDAGNVFIQLVQPLGPGAIHDFLTERGEGFHHVCFAVTNISTVLQALPDEDAALIFVGGRGRRACFLGRQPSGITIELTEHEPVPSLRAESQLSLARRKR